VLTLLVLVQSFSPDALVCDFRLKCWHSERPEQVNTQYIM
jgi:hypothetical protein